MRSPPVPVGGQRHRREPVTDTARLGWAKRNVRVSLAQVGGQPRANQPGRGGGQLRHPLCVLEAIVYYKSAGDP